MPDSDESYVEYVQSIIGKYDRTAKLAHENEVTPSAVNTALAWYLEVSMGMIAELQRAKVEYLDIEMGYQRWYDRAFNKTRDAMIEGKSPTQQAKIALKEYESRFRLDNEEEYYSWQRKLKTAEMRVEFLSKLNDSYKKFDQVLTTLANNMRQEMRTLSLENRMNASPEGASQNKLRTAFPEPNRTAFPERPSAEAVPTPAPTARRVPVDR